MEGERKVVDLTVEKATYGGDFLSRLPDGRPIFIPYVVPGESISVEYHETGKRFLHGRVADVIAASPARVEPRCRHFGVCGGCHYQHIDYEMQLEIKQQIVIEQLERIGGLKGVMVQRVIPSPLEWNYRNHV